MRMESFHTAKSKEPCLLLEAENSGHYRCPRIYCLSVLCLILIDRHEFAILRYVEKYYRVIDRRDVTDHQPSDSSATSFCQPFPGFRFRSATIFRTNHDIDRTTKGLFLRLQWPAGAWVRFPIVRGG